MVVYKCLLNIRFLFFLLWWIFLLAAGAAGQTGDTFNDNASLDQCLGYALKHQPVVAQSAIREKVAKNNTGAALSGWLPQVDVSANYQHYLLQPVSIFPDFSNPEGPKREVTTGVVNTSAIQLNASQNIFDPDLVIAGRASGLYNRQAKQSTKQNLIELVVNVSKAFYDVLLAKARLDFYLEDRTRLEKSLQDARSLFENGLNDKIDFQRAQIALNNVDAEIAGTREEIRVKNTVLKQLMGYPLSMPLTITMDSSKLQQTTFLDTSLTTSHRNRVEYQLQETSIRLQQAEVTRQRMQFLPSLSAYANYNLVYQNDNLNALYDRDFPNSSAGLRLSLPLFSGGQRMFRIKAAKLHLEDMKLDSVNLGNRIRTEFETAMASYKSNMKTLEAARQNVILADGIYNTVRLQYNQGIKSFLEVIVSEADLRSARINELNALYRLITSRIDVDAAVGNISTNY
ncbi:MAG TPA: TolC family protein [Bacteroidales bacterium]|nr:TolC family protein [Bacteroidales bacterium]